MRALTFGAAVFPFSKIMNKSLDFWHKSSVTGRDMCLMRGVFFNPVKINCPLKCQDFSPLMQLNSTESTQSPVSFWFKCLAEVIMVNAMGRA